MTTKEKTSKKEKNIHANHRKRLRKLMLTSDLENLSKHVILEYLLTLCIPLKDTNPISHRLISEFGSIKNVLTATPENLKEINGIGERSAETLQILNKITNYLKTEKVSNEKKSLAKPEDLVNHFSEMLQGEESEIMLLALLDPKLREIKTIQIGQGNTNSVSVDVKKIMEHVLANKSTSMVAIAHNHPKGDALPSSEDIAATHKILEALSSVGIGILDHIIIAENGYLSFYASGYMDEIRSVNISKETQMSNKLLNFVNNKSVQTFVKPLPKQNVLDYPTNRIDA